VNLALRRALLSQQSISRSLFTPILYSQNPSVTINIYKHMISHNVLPSGASLAFTFKQCLDESMSSSSSSSSKNDQVQDMLKMIQEIGKRKMNTKFFTVLLDHDADIWNLVTQFGGWESIGSQARVEVLKRIETNSNLANEGKKETLRSILHWWNLMSLKENDSICFHHHPYSIRELGEMEWNWIIQALSRAENWMGGALKIKSMLEYDIPIYTSNFIHWLQGCSHPEIQVLKDIWSILLMSKPTLLNRKLASSFIHTFGRLGEAQHLSDIYEYIKNNEEIQTRIRLDSFMYGVFIRSFVLAGGEMEAFKLFETAAKLGMNLDVSTITSLLSCTELNAIEELINICLKHGKGAQPDVIRTAIALNEFPHIEEIAAKQELHQLMNQIKQGTDVEHALLHLNELVTGESSNKSMEGKNRNLFARELEIILNSVHEGTDVEEALQMIPNVK